jgi:hypothetical protein
MRETTARLTTHVRKAVADYDSGVIGLSRAQQARATTPAAEARFRGAVIDDAVKAAVRKDPHLKDLWISEKGFYGPDFFHPGSRVWWDITTRGQWQSHLSSYTSKFGQGIGLFTR